MIRLELARWRGRTGRPAVVRLIRRKIRGGIQSSRTILIDFERTGATKKETIEIMAGWDPATAKGCGSIHTLPYPLPEDVRLDLINAGGQG